MSRSTLGTQRLSVNVSPVRTGRRGAQSPATGVQEAIYCLLMMQSDFIAASANVSELDPELKPEEIATSRIDGAGIDTILSNSFGFGGTNATLALSRYRD